MTTIRSAADADGEAVAAIYGPVVRDTVISFELVPPTADEMAARISETTRTHPWLVAEENGLVVGYAYAHAMHGRAAYAWSVETSIYLAEGARGRGVGRALYGVLLPMLEQQGFRQAIAGVALPNPASVRLHEAVGFRPIGRQERIGWKFGAWHDVGYWQRALGVGDAAPPGDIGLPDDLAAPGGTVPPR